MWPFGRKRKRTQMKTWKLDIGGVRALQMASLPSGKFRMGSPNDEKGHREDEGPVHEVRVDAFSIGVYPVTLGQFREFVAATGYQTTMEVKGWQQVWKSHAIVQTDHHPVVLISWHDAKAFCDWLCKKSGKIWRLPTEAEWEYACRAGTTSRFFFGDRDAGLATYAWYDANSHADTHAVGGLMPSPWGLCDILGNAWTWCEDRYEKDYYRSSPRSNPVCTTSHEERDIRVARGGHFASKAHECRSASRHMWGADNPNLTCGFRVVCLDRAPRR